MLSDCVMYRRDLAALLALLCALAPGLPSSAARMMRAENSVLARTQDDDGDHTPGRAAAWDVVDGAAARAAAATDCLGWPTRRIRYTSDDVIHLEGCGSWDPVTNAPDTDPTVADDGSGGRAYIAARSVLTKGRPTAAPTACDIGGGSQEPYEARMSVVNAEIGYLGYDAAESYGMVWKVYYKLDPTDPTDAPPPGRQLYALADVFGGASGSTFHHNYFGSYTFGGYCMRWAGNTFATISSMASTRTTTRTI